MVHRALLVDPDDGRLDALRRGIGHVVDLTTCTSFWKARHQLLTTSDVAPDHIRAAQSVSH